MKWEYRLLKDVHLSELAEDEFQASLNDDGRNGWELISVNVWGEGRWANLIFKRPKAKTVRVYGPEGEIDIEENDDWVSPVTGLTLKELDERGRKLAGGA